MWSLLSYQLFRENQLKCRKSIKYANSDSIPEIKDGRRRINKGEEEKEIEGEEEKGRKADREGR